MVNTQMVAYNTQTGMFLKKIGSNWTITEDFSSASGYPQREMQLAVRTAQKNYPGDWMIIRRQEAMKLLRMPTVSASVAELVSSRSAVPAKQTGASVLGYTMPRTDTCDQILSAVKTLSELVSDDSIKRLDQKQAEADRLVTDIYHYIEVSNLNACQGYKAYKKLKEALVSRRKIKNEYAVAQKLRQSCLSDISRLEMLSERAWDPQTDLFAEVSTNE